MADTSKIRKTLKASHVVKIWFWDGEREYLGEAVELSPDRATGLLKMSQFGNSTVIPTRKVVDGLIKHLVKKAVEFKVTSGILEAAVRARIVSLQVDFENSRRLLLEAEILSPSEHNQKVLRRMAEILNTSGPTA